MADTVSGIDDVRELFDVCETVLSTVNTGEVVLIDSVDVSNKKQKVQRQTHHAMKFSRNFYRNFYATFSQKLHHMFF